jgi:DNA-binding response OmpR family regulator
VRTGADAERIAVTQDVDLAIVDLMIDRGAGLQLCEQLSHTVPVLAVSALDQQDRALTAGAQGFIRKPLDPLVLVSAVRDLIGTSAMLRSSGRVPQG